jgi:hypothetical protein
MISLDCCGGKLCEIKELNMRRIECYNLLGLAPCSLVGGYGGPYSLHPLHRRFAKDYNPRSHRRKSIRSHDIDSAS